MKNVKSALFTLMILSCVAMYGFADAPATNYVLEYGSGVVQDVTTVGSIDVAPTDAIRAWFKANHVDPTIIDAPLGSLSRTQKDSMDSLFADSNNLSALDALIQPVLKKALVRGSIENATMRLGLRAWHMSIYGDEDR